MTFRNKSILFSLFFILFFIGNVHAEKCQVFFINLYYQPVSFQIKKDNTQYCQQLQINPFTVTPLSEINPVKQAKLRFQTKGQKGWYSYYIDEIEQFIDFKTNQIYAIIMFPNRAIEYYEQKVPEKDQEDSNSQICFFNGTNNNIHRMEVGLEWKKNTATFVEKLKPNQLTNFVAIPALEYQLFFQYSQNQESQVGNQQQREPHKVAYLRWHNSPKEGTKKK